jgi:uncharacterized damage-inducible protein DinB
VTDAVLDERGRPEPPVDGDETATLLGFLDFQRATLAWKVSGVDAAGMRARIAVSTMTLGGLLKHLALVEDSWFSRYLHGNDRAEPWNAVDWDADPSWEWRTAAEDTPEQLYAMWSETVARSRANLQRAMAAGDPGAPIAFTWPDGRTPSVRRLLVDLIEEYARHTGHADLLREAVDGLVGEDPPSDF